MFWGVKICSIIRCPKWFSLIPTRLYHHHSRGLKSKHNDHHQPFNVSGGKSPYRYQVSQTNPRDTLIYAKYETNWNAHYKLLNVSGGKNFFRHQVIRSFVIFLSITLPMWLAHLLFPNVKYKTNLGGLWNNVINYSTFRRVVNLYLYQVSQNFRVGVWLVVRLVECMLGHIKLVTSLLCVLVSTQ